MVYRGIPELRLICNVSYADADTGQLSTASWVRDVELIVGDEVRFS